MQCMLSPVINRIIKDDMCMPCFNLCKLKINANKRKHNKVLSLCPTVILIYCDSTCGVQASIKVQDLKVYIKGLVTNYRDEGLQNGRGAYEV